MLIDIRVPNKFTVTSVKFVLYVFRGMYALDVHAAVT